MSPRPSRFQCFLQMPFFFFFLMTRPPPRSPLFPSTPLFRSLWRKHLALLVYLARSPRRTRTREHLLGLLWADRDEKQARHSLSEALRVLRRRARDATQIGRAHV